MSQPFPMPNHPRATIDIAHSIDNDHAITVSYDGVGDHTANHIFLTLHEMPELVRQLTDYVTQQIPMYGLAADDRADFEVALELLQKYLQREQDFQLASAAHGVIAAVPSQGQVEFRALDIDVESQEITGGRSYRVQPNIAAQWLANNVLCVGHMLPLDGLIAIRDTASQFIDRKLSGAQQAQKVSSLVLNAFAVHMERTGQQLQAIKARSLEQSDLDKINRFCSMHRPLRLDPAVMMRVGNEIERLRQATVNVSVKLAHAVSSAIGAASFGAAVAHLDGGQLRYSELNKAELSKSTGALFDKALIEIEAKLKAVLTAATKTRIKLLTRTDSISDWLISSVVEHIAEQYSADFNTAPVRISHEQENHIAQLAEAWFWDSLGAVLEANDMLGLMLTGRDAGIAANLCDFTEIGLVFPIPRKTYL